MSGVSFTFTLLDRMSGPAGGISRSLSGVNRSLRDVDRTSSRLQIVRNGQSPLAQALAPPDLSGFTKQSGSMFSRIRSGLSGAAPGAGELAEGLAAVAGAAALAAGAVLAVGSAALGLAAAGAKYAIEAAAFKTSTITAFSMLTKSDDMGRAVFEQVTKLANKTPFETKQVSDSVKSLMGAGLSAEEAFTVFQSVGDVAAFNNFDPSVLDGMTRAIVKMQSAGKLTGESLEMITENAKGAVSKQSLFAQIAKDLGKDVKDVPKLMEQGKIDAKTAMASMSKLLAEGIGGGKAGGLMEKLGGEIPGLFSTLKDVPFSLVPDVDKSAGIAAFRGFLRDLASATDSESANMQRLKTMVEGTIDAVFGGLFGNPGNKAGIEAVIGKILDGLEALGSGAQRVFPYLKAFGGGLFDGLKAAVGPIGKMFSIFSGGDGKSVEGLVTAFRMLGQAIGVILAAIAILGVVLGFIGGAVQMVVFGVLGLAAVLGGWLVSAVGSALSWLWGLGASAIGIGSAIVQGIGAGISAGWQWLVGLVTGLGTAIIDAVKRILGIASPSRVMAGLGEFTAEGFAGGVVRGTAAVDSAVAGMVGVPAAAATGAGSRGGAGTGPITVQVQVDARGAAEGEGDKIAARLEAMLPSALAAALERMALEAGAVGPEVTA